MCLLIALSRVLPDWPLVVAANRDERYERPAEPLGILRPDPLRVLGGRDLLAGGTWLAINEKGVAAGLTNTPNPEGRDPTKRSRGEIPLALCAADHATTAVESFAATSAPGEFNPCWLLVGDRTHLFMLDLTRSEELVCVELPAGVHVLENKPPGAPSSKIDHVREALGELGDKSGDEVLGALLGVLRDHTVTHPPLDDSEESRRLAGLSSCCVHLDGYGTRSSTLVRVPRSPLATPEVWASNGPSCTNPLTEGTFDL